MRAARALPPDPDIDHSQRVQLGCRLDDRRGHQRLEDLVSAARRIQVQRGEALTDRPPTGPSATRSPAPAGPQLRPAQAADQARPARPTCAAAQRLSTPQPRHRNELNRYARYRAYRPQHTARRAPSTAATVVLPTPPCVAASNAPTAASCSAVESRQPSPERIPAATWPHPGSRCGAHPEIPRAYRDVPHARDLRILRSQLQDALRMRLTKGLSKRLLREWRSAPLAARSKLRFLQQQRPARRTTTCLKHRSTPTPEATRGASTKRAIQSAGGEGRHARVPVPYGRTRHKDWKGALHAVW